MSRARRSHAIDERRRASGDVGRRRPNPVLIAGVVSLTLTLLAGWWFVLRAPERSDVALCSSLTRLDGLEERIASDPRDLDEDVALLSRAVRVAPEDVAEDVESLARAVATVHDEASRSEDGGDTDAATGLRAGMARIEPSADDLSASSERVVTWAGEHCGLKLGGETAAAPTATEDPRRG